MNFEQYVSENRQSKKNKPSQDIAQRWQTRVLPQGLQVSEQGAEMYLSVYGKSIGSAKCIMFARYAEEQGSPAFAQGMWKKAFIIDHPYSEIVSQVVDAIADVFKPVREAQGETFDPLSCLTMILGQTVEEGYLERNPFPEDMQPGKLVTMQPCDAQHSRAYYCQSSAYWGQAKRDGNKLIVFASPDKVWYQSRSLKINSMPNAEMDSAFRFVASQVNSFILEGEIYYVDVNGKEHMTGATCMESNRQLGHPEAQPRQMFTAFECLQIGHNARTSMKWERIRDAETVMRMVMMQDFKHFEMLETARTRKEKQDLCAKQKAEGREGEVWFLSDLTYHPGKITSSRDPQFDGYVRTKYSIGIQKYRITKVEPSHAAGHSIGGFSIEDTDGNAVGSVGTGYSRKQQAEILRRFTASDDTWVLVDAQCLTQYKKLRHARFIGFPRTKK